MKILAKPVDKMKSADKETAVVNVYASAVYLELVFANTLKKVK